MTGHVRNCFDFVSLTFNNHFCIILELKFRLNEISSCYVGLLSRKILPVNHWATQFLVFFSSQKHNV